jgi:hypothetical protein
MTEQSSAQTQKTSSLRSLSFIKINEGEFSWT